MQHKGLSAGHPFQMTIWLRCHLCYQGGTLNTCSPGSVQALVPSRGPGGQASILYKHRDSTDLDERIKGLLLVVLWDNFCEELVFTLGQFDKGTNAVDVRVDLDVEDVVPPCKGKMPLVYTGSSRFFWESWFWLTPMQV